MIVFVLAKVPCLNRLHGCKFVVSRKNVSLHLRHCPAMIVSCHFRCDHPTGDCGQIYRLDEHDDHNYYRLAELDDYPMPTGSWSEYSCIRKTPVLFDLPLKVSSQS